VFQRWSGVIRRETRDLFSLEQIGARALADPDVHDDPTLESMIRADLQKRRGEIEQKLQSERLAAAATKSVSDQRSTPSEPIPTASPDEIRDAFNRLAEALSTSLEQGNEREGRALFGRMRALQEQHPGMISAAPIDEYKVRVEELLAHVRQLTDEIAALTQQAVAASRKGTGRDIARSMRRLTAIHAAHPRLLDEPGLEGIRRDVAEAANERREHRRTTKQLLDRERAITAEIQTLAAAVRHFHRVACSAPDTSEAFREAEATYLRTIQKVRTYDTEWFSGVVLELADLLAEWTVPPPEAEGQIERFLDSISAGLDRIRAEMREIESEQDPDKDNEDASAVP
jgi:hypothetical protein